MKQPNNIPQDLETTIKNTSLKELGIDAAELILDNCLENGLLKEIPLVKSILGIYSGVTTIQNQLLLKKVLYFLTEIDSVPLEQRKIMIEKIDKSQEYKMKIGEKLLYILENVDDWEKSQILGAFFKEYLQENLPYKTFLKTVKALDPLTTEDLKDFVQVIKKLKDQHPANLKIEWLSFTVSYEKNYNIYCGELLNTSLFISLPEKIEVRERKDFMNCDQYEVEGGGLEVRVSEIGRIIFDILSTSKALN